MSAKLFRLVINLLLFGMSMIASALLVTALVLTPQHGKK